MSLLFSALNWTTWSNCDAGDVLLTMLDVTPSSPLSRRAILTPTSIVSTESELFTTQVGLLIHCVCGNRKWFLCRFWHQAELNHPSVFRSSYGILSVETNCIVQTNAMIAFSFFTMILCKLTVNDFILKTLSLVKSGF